MRLKVKLFFQLYQFCPLTINCGTFHRTHPEDISDPKLISENPEVYRGARSKYYYFKVNEEILGYQNRLVSITLR